MKELKCRNCGAPLTPNGKCEYCGSIYKIPEDPMIMPVLIQDAQAITLEARIDVPMHVKNYLTPEEISKCTIEELKNKLADAVAAYMTIDMNHDIINMKTKYRGRVRLIPPSFRF